MMIHVQVLFNTYVMVGKLPLLNYQYVYVTVLYIALTISDEVRRCVRAINIFMILCTKFTTVLYYTYR